LSQCDKTAMNATSSRKQNRDPRLVEGVLANLPLMEGVGRNVIRQLSTQSALLDAKRGETVVRGGETVRGVYAIAHGSMKMRLRHREGDELVLALLGPGETFAEVPALLASPAKAEVVALTDSMLIVISAGCIGAQALSEPRLARNVTNILARRMQALLGEFERGMLPSLQRLAAYLDSIAEPEAPGRWIARLPVSKTLVAARLGVKKETLSRLLRELAERGLISVVQREVKILDRNALAAVTR